MKVRKLPEARHIGINVTPMIDLMMCLIIFFLLAAKLASDDNDKEVVLPKIRQVRKLSETEITEGRLTVNILPADPAKQKNSTRFIVRGEEVSLERIDAMMRKAVAENKKMKLAIRPSFNVRYTDIQNLMIRAGRALVPEVIFAAGNVGSDED